MNRILFIDRDGTLIDEPKDGKVDDLAKLKFKASVCESLSRLIANGFSLVMVTNQPDLGTTLFPQEKFEGPQQALIQKFESFGVNFKEILICPHEENSSCGCQKPATGLVQKYLTGDLDYRYSYVIGDRASDMRLAENMGLQGIQYDDCSNNWPAIVEKILSVVPAERSNNTPKGTELTFSPKP